MTIILLTKLLSFSQLKSLICILAFMLFSNLLSSQVSITPWRMNKGGGIIYYSIGYHGNPIAYNKANIPNTNASGWTTAPTNSNGEIHYSVRSILSRCLSQLDFTYFETFIDIPNGYVINDLNVKFSAADDGARAYIFNSDHPNGAYIGEIRLGQTPVTANYASLAKAGEKNRLVIVQFDDCPSGNNLTGAQVKVNGEVAPVSNLTFSSNNSSCTYTADGSATVNVSGGQGPFTYLWSNGQTTSTATNLTSGTYNVTVTDGLNRQSTGSVTVNTAPGPDNDGDGVSDACDNDDDNDGILDSAECINSNFFWSSSPIQNGNKITGVINGIGYTYTSNVSFSTTSYLFGHHKFPSQYNVPNQTSIRNDFASENTLTFDQPIKNPVLVFASIGGGQPSPTVNIQFHNDFSVVWAESGTTTVDLNAKRVTGTEGNIIIRFEGTFSQLTFNYLNAESWVNFAFGADFFTYCDTDNDGIVDVFDLDSDNDGCSDTIEAGYIDSNSDGFPGGSTITVDQYGKVNLNSSSGQNSYILDIPDIVTDNNLNGCNEPPIAKAKDITVSVDANCTVTVTNKAVDDGSSDPDGDELIYSLSSNGPFSIGTHTVTMTVTDPSNESSSAKATITVIDDIAPEAKTKNITVELDVNGNATINANQINNGSSDNCAVESMDLDTTTFTCNNLGENTVNLTVTDSSGNTSSASAIVKVVDNISPTVHVKNISIPLVNGEANIDDNSINDGTFDNCDVTLSINRNNFSCSDIGDHEVTLTATDSSGNASSKTATVTIEGEVPEVTIDDFTAVNSQKSNTIFLGYGPQSMELTTTSFGGDSFTYQWTASSGEPVSNVANPTISPTATTTYTVLVTNNFGCTTTASIEVCVIDARSYNKKGKPNGKVVICHHTYGKKGTKHVTINISKSAVSKHIANHGEETDHGDSLGPCNATCIQGDIILAPKSNTSDNLIITPEINIYPNPSKGIFEIKYSNLKEGTLFNLIDVTGKLIDQKSISSSDRSQNITIGNRNLPSGIYILRIISTEETITKKLIVNKE